MIDEKKTTPEQPLRQETSAPAQGSAPQKPNEDVQTIHDWASI